MGRRASAVRAVSPGAKPSAQAGFTPAEHVKSKGVPAKPALRGGQEEDAQSGERAAAHRGVHGRAQAGRVGGAKMVPSSRRSRSGLRYKQAAGLFASRCGGRAQAGRVGASWPASCRGMGTFCAPARWDDSTPHFLFVLPKRKRAVDGRRRRKLHIVRFAASGKTHSFHCVSSPHKISDFAGAP